MGCDIHMLAEKKVDGKWEKVGVVFDNIYGEGKTDSPYQGRNYELFAFLAGVRNRFDIDPICEPKGFPEDASKEVKEGLFDYWDSDGHNASYFTLEELQNADWSREIKIGGVVPADVYEYLKQNKEAPKSYFQEIAGNGIKTLSEEEWEVLPWEEKKNGTRWHVYMYWNVSIKEECSNFVEKTMEVLKKLGDPKEIRIVFLFDN